MFILVGDTHLGLYKSSDIWHNVTINLFKEIVETALNKNIDTIIHFGDFFNDRKSTNNKTIEVAYEIEEILKPVKTYIITGNHDIYYKNKLKPSSLTLFKNSPHINVISETYDMLDEDIVMIPWGQEIPEDTIAEFCFGHFDINDCYMNNKAKCDKGKYNVNDFKQFNHVYSGHFHTPSTNGNITYLGSPFQQTFHDVGSSRGYYIFDNGKIEFIEYKNYPKFTIIKSGDIIKKEDIQNNIIKLVFKENLGTNKNIKLVEELQLMSPITLNVDFGKIPMEDNEGEISNDIVIEGHNKIIEEWIDKDKNRPSNIKKKKAKDMLNKILEEIC